MFTYGVFLKELEAAFGWSRTVLSGASSFAFLMTGIGGIVAGILNDRIGPRIILTIAGIFLGIGYILMSQMSLPWQLYLPYGVFVGLGIASHDVITLSTITRWFVKRRGAMSGVVKVGTGVGQFLGPLIAAALIAQFNWRSAYLFIGIFSLLGWVTAAQLMKRDPQEMGLQPDGDPPLDPSNKKLAKFQGLTLHQAIRTSTFWILCLSQFIIFYCLLTTIVHIVPHAREQGLEATTAAAVLSAIGGLSIIGRLAIGTANDHIGGKKCLLVSYSLLFGALIWLQFAENAWMLFAFALVYGFAHGAFFTVISPTIAEFFGTLSHGLIFGIVLFCGTLGGSVGPLLAGYIFDLTNSYRLAFLTLAGVAMVGLILVTQLRSVGLVKEGEKLV